MELKAKGFVTDVSFIANGLPYSPFPKQYELKIRLTDKLPKNIEKILKEMVLSHNYFNISIK